MSIVIFYSYLARQDLCPAEAVAAYSAGNAFKKLIRLKENKCYYRRKAENTRKDRIPILITRKDRISILITRYL